MKTRILAATASLALALGACSGGETTDEATDETEAGETAEATDEAAVYDPASEEGQAYRALLECGATMAAAGNLIGAVSINMDDAAREAARADEEARDARAEALRAQAVTAGAALGLSGDAVEAEFSEFENSFVQGPEDGTMEEFAASVGEQADSCAAEYE